MTFKTNPYERERPKGKVRDGSMRAERYARDIVEGRITSGAFVKGACERHFADVERSENDPDYQWTFDHAKASRCVAFAELLPNIRGKFAGHDAESNDSRRVRLLDWQCFFLSQLFGWVDRETKLRRFQHAYLSVARKNGKTFLAVIAGLYAYLFEKHVGGEFYSAAGDERQAGISWHMARSFLKMTPELVRSYELVVPSSAARTSVLQRGDIETTWSALPREAHAGSLDGYNATFILADEVHGWYGNASDMVAALQYAQEGQRDPMFLCVTTSGVNIGEWWHRNETELLQPLVLGKLADPDDRSFYLGYHMDDDDSEEDESAWIKANPSLGVVQSPESIRRELRRLKALPRERNMFLIKRLNMWLGATSRWFNEAQYAAAKVPIPADPLAEYEGYRCYIGLVAAYAQGVAAMAFLFKAPGDDAYRLRVEYWVPESRALDDVHLDIAAAVKNPWDGLHVVPGETVPFDMYVTRVRQVAKHWNVQIVGYERGRGADNMDADMEELRAMGYPIGGMRNTQLESTDRIDEFAALVAEDRLKVEANPMFDRQLQYTGIETDRSGKRSRLIPLHGSKQWDTTTGPRAVIFALGSTTARTMKTKNKVVIT